MRLNLAMISNLAKASESSAEFVHAVERKFFLNSALKRAGMKNLAMARYTGDNI